LLAFMQRKGDMPKVSQQKRGRTNTLASVRPRQLKLQPIKSTYGRGYSAQVDIGFLRIYTRAQRNIEKAIEHQLILSQMRNALCTEAAADHEVWKDVDKIQTIVGDVLGRNGSSPKELDLRTCVQMRATEYVHRKYVITSPVMPLAKALALRAHLLSARNVSWESFRAQWIKLMCSTRNARSRNLSQKDAEEIANKARQDFLKSRLKTAVRSVEQVLQMDECRAGKQSKRARQSTRFTQAALGIQRGGGYRECGMWKDRMKLLLQREMSPEEILRYSKSRDSLQKQG